MQSGGQAKVRSTPPDRGPGSPEAGHSTKLQARSEGGLRGHLPHCHHPEVREQASLPAQEGLQKGLTMRLRLESRTESLPGRWHGLFLVCLLCSRSTQLVAYLSRYVSQGLGIPHRQSQGVHSKHGQSTAQSRNLSGVQGSCYRPGSAEQRSPKRGRRLGPFV